MTIREAVEHYNIINNIINEIKDTITPILKQELGPLGDYKINSTDMAKITNYLMNYVKLLESKLDDDFK